MKAIFQTVSKVLTVDPNPLMSLFGNAPGGMQLPAGGGHKVVALATLLAWHAA